MAIARIDSKKHGRIRPNDTHKVLSCRVTGFTVSSVQFILDKTGSNHPLRAPRSYNVLVRLILQDRKFSCVFSEPIPRYPRLCSASCAPTR